MHAYVHLKTYNNQKKNSTTIYNYLKAHQQQIYNLRVIHIK